MLQMSGREAGKKSTKKSEQKRVYVHDPPKPSPTKHSYAQYHQRSEGRQLGTSSFINKSSMILEGETDITINAYGGRNSLLKQITPSDADSRQREPFLTAKEELKFSEERSGSYVKRKSFKSSLTLSSSITSVPAPPRNRLSDVRGIKGSRGEEYGA